MSSKQFFNSENSENVNKQNPAIFVLLQPGLTQECPSRPVLVRQSADSPGLHGDKSVADDPVQAGAELSRENPAS